MTLSRDSLSGQNSLGRQSGARSSRALSTIFKQLRKLDREITELDKTMAMYPWMMPKAKKKRALLDAKRRDVRLLRKGTLTAQ